MARTIDNDPAGYAFLFREGQTAFSDRALRLALSHGGALRMMFEDKRPAGYIIVDRDDKKYWLAYAYTVPKKRRQGIFTDLLKSFLAELDGSLRLTALAQGEEYEVIRRTAARLGFKPGEGYTVYCMKKADVPRWKEYREKHGQFLLEALEKQGFHCFPFRKAGDEVLRQLMESPDNEFQNEMPVRGFILNPSQNTDFDRSFVSVKDGKAAAYTLMTRQDAKSLVCEQNSTAKRYIGTGCIVQPFFYMVDAFADSGIFERAVFTIYDKNQAAHAFCRKIAKLFDFSGQRFVNFLLEKRNGRDEIALGGNQYQDLA